MKYRKQEGKVDGRTRTGRLISKLQISLILLNKNLLQGKGGGGPDSMDLGGNGKG